MPDDQKDDDTPICIATSEQLWTELSKRFDAAMLVVLIRDGNGESIRIDGAGASMFEQIGMLEAARQSGLGAMAPIQFDENGDIIQ